MKVLLLIPINRTYVIMPSLGLGYIAAVLKKAGHQVQILHCVKEGLTFAGFEKHLRENDYDVVGIQMFTFDITPTQKHLAIIKRLKPNMVTVIGGYHPSGDPELAMKEQPDADFAFCSEVEISFPIFLKEIGSSQPDFSKIPNLVWRSGSQLIINQNNIVEALDEIPFPAWELMDPRTYPEAPHGGFYKSFPTAPIIITRGCPMKCTFCAGKSITTEKIRVRSVANVIEEIKLLKTEYGVNDFLIEDENFTLHKKIVYSFCEALLRENLRITWSCPAGVRIDTLNKEILAIMERSGCHSLAVGIEFGSQRIHDLTKKSLSVDMIREQMKLFKGSKIKTTGFFMFGIPGETREEMLQTIKFAKQLNIDRAQFNNFMPLPGSAIYREMKQNGMKSIAHQHFFVHDVSYVPAGMTEKEMKNIQRKAYLEFYFRPKIIWGILKELVSFRQFVYLFKHFLDGLR